MKKLTAILLAAFMLISMISTAFAVDYTADVTDYLRYILEMGGRVDGWPTNSFKTHYTDTWSGFRTNKATTDPETRSGVIKAEGTAMGKSADDPVMQALISTSDLIDVFGYFDQNGDNNGVFNGYKAGEKIHMSAQYYLPRAESYYNEATKGMRMGLTLYEGSTTTLYNPSTTSVEGTDATLIFAPTSADGGKFYFLGVLEADQTWNAETCYTVDLVLAFGEVPTLSLYVNGAPLTFGETLVDGVTNTSENVKLNKASYGIAKNYYFIMTPKANSEGMTYIYSDNWVFENLSAGDEPQIYNPVSFKNIKEGDSLLINENAEVTVNVDLADCSEVELFVNDESVGSLAEKPFTFVLPSDLTTGKAILKAVATAGGIALQNSLSVSLGKSYGRKSMDEDFEEYANFQKSLDGGWYQSSSDFYGQGHAPNGWFIEPRTVTDKAQTDFEKSFVIGCQPGAQEAWLDNTGRPHSDLKYGFKGFNGNGAIISGNKVEINFQMYVENENMNVFSLNLGAGANVGNQIFAWDTTEEKLKWNVSGDTVYTEPKMGYWQNYVLAMDISSTSVTKASLTVDGEEIFTDRNLAVAIPSFQNIIWYMIPDLEKGCCVGLDEIVITHTVPRPSFGDAVFYQGDIGTATSVPADTNAVAVTVNNGLLADNLEHNVELLENGEVLTFVDDDGQILKAQIKLADNKLWIVPPRPFLSNTQYIVRLKKNAVFADNATIGYNQDFVFQTKSSAIDVVNTEYYKNGIKIENLSDVTFEAGDKIKAKVTLCNSMDMGEPVHILMLGYNNTLLSAYESLPITITAGATDQTVETPEITVTDPVKFSSTAVVVRNSDFLPIAGAKSVSGNQ